MKRILFVIAATAVVSFGLTGCSDGCPDGQHSEATGHHQVWQSGHTTYVNGKVHTTPGHFATVTDYQCKADK